MPCSVLHNPQIWNSSDHGRTLFPESENTFYLNYENVRYEFIKKGATVRMLNIYENGKLIEEAKRK